METKSQLNHPFFKTRAVKGMVRNPKNYIALESYEAKSCEWESCGKSSVGHVTFPKSVGGYACKECMQKISDDPLWR